MVAAFNSKKLINGWVMYDWANSVFALVITSSLFPIYFENITKNIATQVVDGGKIHYIIELAGLKFENTALYSYALAFAFLILMLLSPVLSGIADSLGLKKRMMQLFCTIGSLSCMSLFFFQENTLWIGLLGIIVGMVGFNGSIVFYNSFLPLITTEDNFDKVSARGFAMGYFGSVLLLLFNLTMILKPDWFGGISPKNSTQLSFLLVGVWWLLFAQITFRVLPTEISNNEKGPNVFAKGFHTLRDVWIEVRHLPETRRFLAGFFFCSMGLQTIMLVATLFGTKELKLPQDRLLITILLIQLLGIAGAFLFSRISQLIGNIYSILITIIIWIGITLYAFFALHTEMEFYFLASTVGMVMGALQTLLRSTYAKIIPDGTPNLASYFSFLDVTEKAAIAIGLFSYGLIEEVTGGMRNATLFLSIYFLFALIFIARIRNFKVHKG